jgi:hypothetical protein
MTLLGALLTPEVVYAFAHGRAEHSGGMMGGTSLDRDKFNHVENEPLAWGVIGNPDVAISFGKSLSHPQTKQWPEFAKGIRDEWTGIRGEQFVELRQGLGLWPSGSISGIQGPENMLVVTGFVGGKPGITVTKGMPDERTTETQLGLYSYGPWRCCVEVAWATVLRHNPKATMTTEKNIRDLLEPVVDTLKGLYLPVNIWEITPDGGFTKSPA